MRRSLLVERQIVHIGCLDSPNIEYVFVNTSYQVNINAEAHLSCYFYIRLWSVAVQDLIV